MPSSMTPTIASGGGEARFEIAEEGKSSSAVQVRQNRGAALAKADDVVAPRDSATLRLEGKSYVVQDGEVVHFRFSV